MSKSNTYTVNEDPSSPQLTYDANPPTIAAFSPTTSSGYSATSKQRSTVIVHKKSPLLVATPPQITRALAHSHPFLLPLNKLVGLVSWTTDDPWESYLLVAAFWAVTLYGGLVIRYTGPLIFVTFLILGMYSRRYSPLSSTSATGEKHSRSIETPTKAQHKSLDEIVDTLSQFTSRCNILLDPFLTMTDFLSTQRTPTSATTRPALTTLFIRILLVSPLWVALTLPPLHILTPRRIILFTGTTVLTWHSRPARVTRVLLWRSLFLRRLSSLITGLSFPSPGATSGAQSTSTSQHNTASALASTATRKPASSGVRFTFILYENQRRWIGLGWTTSLFAYERGPWSDEHLNPAPSKDEFELPDVDNGASKWRWVEGSDWRIERGDHKQHARNLSTGSRTSASGSGSAQQDGADGDGGGWIYYDNKWEDGKREDGWGRYTRRRKWYRDAELVEASPNPTPNKEGASLQSEDESDESRLRRARDYAEKLSKVPGSPSVVFPPKGRDGAIKTAPTTTATATATSASTTAMDSPAAGGGSEDPTSPKSSATATAAAKRKSGWFGRARSDSKSSSSKNTGLTKESTRSRDGPEVDHIDKWRDQARGFSVGGDDVSMGLG